ncbi:uncharacterized protein At4g10930 isoform X1 [Ziziphus jujuba]|uniref:Uncharacterized protein At4g10930 isoform X1 n=1 Tax=Ziziphus jujuba TaxID=326968 RepID=A0ABM3I4A8_ZIZJJ|nr:uncharacterized protein At4g10930 isoform X1 [Ziziphus jujuba]
MEVDLITSGVAEEEAIEVDDFSNNFGNVQENPNMEGERCGICMDVIIDRGVLDCCQHWFCFACIDNWATITNLCPLCQNEFQLITCVPVDLNMKVYDTIGSCKVDDDSYTRDDDWSIEGKNNTLSFPSYYIDENAVICLDGDGCKIRIGSVSTEGDPNLDTSIACDSCDLWYHAFCVGFNPEGTSESTWLCPRCIVDEVPQKPDGNIEQRPSGPENFNEDCSVEDIYSRKVSISVADAGETALVVSMVGGSKLTEELSDNIPSTIQVDKELKTKTFILASEDNSQTVATPSREHSKPQQVMGAQELELSLSCDTSSSFPSNCLTCSEVKTNADEQMDWHRSFDCVKSSLGNVVNESHISNTLSDNNSGMGVHLGLSVGSFLTVDKMNYSGTDDQMNEDVKQDKPSEECISEADKTAPDADDDAPEVIGVKRKHLECSVSDTANESADDGDVKPKIETEISPKKIKAERRVEVSPAEDQADISVSDDSQNSTLKAVPRNGRLRLHPEKENSTSDIMSIVGGTRRKLSKNVGCPSSSDDKSSKDQETMAGLRVKKIMKRAAEDKDSSMVVQELRKKIREAVRNKPTKDIGENIFDPKLLAAFRAAVAVPTTEPVKTLSHLSMKAKKSMMQKGKVRENLTKKIYASNGRRKRAWDRDCEIEFWKHRCMRASKPEKIQTLKSVLDLLRNESDGTETEQRSEKRANPILSRLYLADTSVFPRKDDIKPLSALKTSSDSEKNSKQVTMVEKCVSSSLDNHTSSSTQTNKVSSKVGIPSSETSGKRKTVPSSKENSATSKVHLNRNLEVSSVSSLGSSKSNAKKETATQSKDIKIDKRKWALQVLARKTTGAGGNATNEKEEDIAVLKGNYPLLAQLPMDMRPVLAPSHHNKIPLSVRQAQLYRLTEHFLRKANLPVIYRTAETELAVADAVNIEKGVADRSNSKLVYLNLCSQEILHRSENSKSSGAPVVDSSSLSAVSDDRSEQNTNQVSADDAIEKALRTAGLSSDSPPSSPDHQIEALAKEEPSSTSLREEEPENVFDIDYNPDLDIYGDFDYNLEDEDYIGAGTVKVSKEQQEGLSKLKVVFSTLQSETESTSNALDFGKSENLGNAEILHTSSCMLNDHTEVNFKNSTMEGGTDKSYPLEPLLGKEGEDLSAAEYEELYGPDKEPLVNRFPEGASSEPFGLIGAKAVAENEDAKNYENRVQNQSTKESESGQESKKELCATGAESSSNNSEMGENVPRKEKKSSAGTNKQSDSSNSISKKVEAYVKEHIRPLCKSGVITTEQYRWAVAKATDKVMKYHYKAKNANFLIKEGEKVKKLVEQYVEAAKQKDKSDSV